MANNTMTVQFYKTNSLHMQIHIHNTNPLLHVSVVDGYHEGATLTYSFSIYITMPNPSVLYMYIF
jgi:hypothetical protein